VWVYLW